ncbi:MAG: hypothetical protein ACOCW8_00290 [bacterium]
MSFVFHPDAEDELGRAIEVYSAIQRAVAHPKAWSSLEGEIRRVLIRRFPYGVLYTEKKDGLFILAVMHLHRDPEYWKTRR